MRLMTQARTYFFTITEVLKTLVLTVRNVIEFKVHFWVTVHEE